MSVELVFPRGRPCAQSGSAPGQNAQALRSREPVPPPAVAVLDPAVIAELQELGDGGQVFLREVLTEYVEQAAGIVAAMRASLRANDIGSFVLGAHALGGSSLQVGAALVARICHEIQNNEHDAPATFAAALEALASEVVRVNAAVALDEWGPMLR